MQQWWDNDGSSDEDLERLKSKDTRESDNSANKIGSLKENTFTVEAETTVGQQICVSGNCDALGNWSVNEAVVLTNTQMTRERNNRTHYIWTGKVDLPTDKQVLFRYFVAYILEPDGVNIKKRNVLVHSWESHYEPRVVPCNDEAQGTSCDLYGIRDGSKQVNRGFLTKEYAIQFKLYNYPIRFWKSKLENQLDLVCVKVTPVQLSKLPPESGDASPSNLLSEDLSSRGSNAFGWPFVEVTNIPGDYSFQLQKQFGTLLKKDTLHIYQTKVHNFAQTGYLFDIYLQKESFEQPPYHVGFTYVLPNSMKHSTGVIIAPITSIRHQPIGELKIDYFIVKPSKNIVCTMEKVKTIDWKSSYDPLDIGHRGSGSTFKKLISDCSNIRENTIASLREAANKGADFVEFDVQLTNDLVPIIYHDFKVSMATRSKTDILAEDVEMIQVPLKQFSFEQLQRLKIYHVKEPYSLSKGHFLNDTRNDYQPFPKLEKAFTNVDVNVGFNVELKWTMELQDGSYELENPFDMNLFVDKILQTTFEHANTRSIVFSCFHPDVCTMLRMKQNKYPVMFLTQGVTKRYPSYEDPRCHTIQSAVYHAACHDLMGINVHSEDLLRDPSQISMVKKTGLALFCWGDDNNCKDVVNEFKRLGVNAIIYDKLDKSEFKKSKCSSDKPTFFITEDCCDQNLLFIKKDEVSTLQMSEVEQNDKNKYVMDIGKNGFKNQCASTISLWNEECNGNLKNAASKIQRFDNDEGAQENHVMPSSSKKLKSDE
ncbi:glycerophosphocholine phosphodiesterase GPCPD1 [Adelges cooleyi]|uniref:glycerophosphocholine phosphodiesterase GPCPD1 n=1 Tax=Adelges cooleyi TaxID=133065 RepID=UPI00217FF9A2|nr:glycerophosphocholine phosphodiesterase GPCPD1 [Adelges cooleyi]